jgi:hypothetical protein
MKEKQTNNKQLCFFFQFKKQNLKIYLFVNRIGEIKKSNSTWEENINQVFSVNIFISAIIELRSTIEIAILDPYFSWLVIFQEF